MQKKTERKESQRGGRSHGQGAKIRKAGQGGKRQQAGGPEHRGLDAHEDRNP